MEAKPLGKPQPPETNGKERTSSSPWNGLSISALEADLAYFHARLEWIGKQPKTRNQKAQIDTFRMLIPAFIKIVNRLKRKAAVKS